MVKKKKKRQDMKKYIDDKCREEKLFYRFINGKIENKKL